jgi:hypothetical protein
VEVLEGVNVLMSISSDISLIKEKVFSMSPPKVFWNECFEKGSKPFSKEISLVF